MKRLIILLSYFCVAAVASSEQVAPELIVRSAIESAHNNDLGGALRAINFVEMTDQSPEYLIMLLRTLNIPDLQFASAGHKLDDEQIKVRLLAPRKVDFFLTRERTQHGKPTFQYRISKVHPTEPTR